MVSRSVVRTINELAFTQYIARRNWRAVGRIWLWYWDGTNIVYQSRPAGGGSWTSPEAVRSCNAALEFATWFDGTYFHYAYSQGQLSTPDTTVFYRRGLANADGSITWSAAEQTVQAHLSSYRRRNLSICVDDGGYPWIAWHRSLRTGSANYYPFVTTSSTNDGTWTTATGYPFQVIGNTVSWYVSLVPMTSGKVMLFYGGNWRLYGRVLTAVSKGSQTLISGYQVSNRQLRHNAVAIGDIVYLCYQWGTAAIRFQVYNGGWGAISTPVTPADRPGLLAKKDDSTLMLFWENAASIIKYKEYTISGGSWGSEETLQDETTDTILSWSVMQASYDGGGRPFLHYATKAGAPYDMIFAEWEPPHADLLGEFVVTQWQEDLPASFHVGQDSAELRGNVGIRHAGTPIELLGNAVTRHVGTPVELLGNAVLRQPGSAELLGKVDVGQDSAELLGNAAIRQPGSSELLGKFAAQVTAELLGNAEIRQSGPKPWIVGWNLRKSHTITGSVAGAQTNYPIGIKFYYGSGTDGTETIGGATFGKVYCDSKCRTDFGDIRFTKSDETSLLDFWIEEQVNSDYAIIWVEIDSIPASPGTTDIYIYYGNAGATTTSNGDDTFLIFNDCITTTGWSIQLIVGSPAWGTAIMDGATTIYIEANNHNEKLRIQYDTILSTGRENRRALTRVKHTSWNADGYFNWYTPLILGPTQYDSLRYSSYFDYYTIYASVGGVSDTTNYNAGHPSGWYRYEKKTNAAGAVTGYRDDTELGTATVDGDYSGGKVTYYVNEWNAGLTKHYIDWFAIGKYVDPEPTHSTWGPETTAVGGVLPAQFDVGQDSADLLGKVDITHSADLLGIVDITHSADLLGMFDVGQNAVDLKATFDGQVSLNLPAQFEVYHRRANLKAQFTIRHSIPGPVVFGPILIEAATSDAVRFSFQRKSFRALGRIWVFYTDGTNIRVSSSKDGFTWKAPVTVRVGDDGEDFSVVEQNGYVHYAYASNELGGDLYYRRGLLAPDGSISWDPEQTAQTTSKYIRMPFIGIDSSDHPWIGYRYNLGSEGSNYMYRFRSSSTNDGTWVTDVDVEPSGALYAIWAGSVSPISGDRMHIFYGYDIGNLYTNLWDGSLGGILLLGKIRSRLAHSVTSVGDVVYVVYQKRTTNDLVFRKWDGSWGSEVIIQSAFPSIGPAICAIDANELYVFYVDGTMIKYFRSEDAGATWTGPFDLKYVNGLPSYWEFNVFSNSGSPIIGIPVNVGTDASFILYDLDWAPELPAEFEVGQGSVELLAEFVVKQWFGDFLGKFDVGQGSAELLSKVGITHSVDLLGKFDVGQDSAELLSKVGITHSVDLLGKFDVGQGSADLLALFLIPRAYDFSGGMGISFDWWGSGGVDQNIDFEMWSLTGGWVGRFPDGAAEWRQVQLSWDDLTPVDLDGTMPDRSQIIGIYWTYHTPGVRRIDGIRAWMRQDLLCKVVIKNASASDLLSRFEIQASQDLLCKFETQATQGFNDLKAGFYVEMVILPGGLWDYQYVWQNLAAELEVGAQQGQIEVDPATGAITARQRHAINERNIITMCGGYRAYSKGTFIFDAEASIYSGANPVYTPAFGLVENKYDWFTGASAHAAMLYSDGAGGWNFYTEDDGDTESTAIIGIDFTTQHTFKIIWEDASEYPAGPGRVRLYIDDVLKATHETAVPTHPLLFFLLMDSYIVAYSTDNVWTKLYSFSATGVA